MRFLRIVLLFAVLAVIVPSCKSREERTPRPAGVQEQRSDPADLTSRPGNIYKVQYNTNTMVIKYATAAKSLQSASADGTVLVFDASEPALANVAAGRVLLLERIALVKVKDIKREDGRLAILTEPAALPEAIQNGVIQWNLPVRFAQLAKHQAALPRNEFGWPGLITTVDAAPSGYSLSGEKNGWKYKMQATPGPGRLNLAVNMSKSVSGIDVTLDAEGYIPDFDSFASIEIVNSAVKQVNYRNSNLSGEVQMTISAATKSAPGGFGKKQVKLPAVLKVPFFVGALPFTLEISSAITFTPGLGANNQLATAKFHLTYSNLNGFSFEGGGGGAKQNGSSEGEGEIVDFRGVALAGIGVVAGISMPRLEFKLGTTSIVDAIERALPTDIGDMFKRTFLGNLANQALADAEESIKSEGALHVQVILVGSILASGPISLIPCQKSTFSLRAEAGAGASFVGRSLGEVSIDLFNKEIAKTNPPNIKCG